jgi:TetR/AcrR family transcriptional regulator, hemagglutinin/protease regulatory protein
MPENPQTKTLKRRKVSPTSKNAGTKPAPQAKLAGTDAAKSTSRTKPAKPGRRRLSPEARRAELMESAIAVFARRGLGEARHAEIAEVAGVAVATVFFYFPTREALVAAVLDDVGRFLLGMAERVHASNAPANAVLLDHIQTFADSVESAPAYARIWLDWSTAVRDEVWKRYLEFLDTMLAIVGGTLERGQREGTISATSAPEDQARLLVGSAHMLALMKIAGSPPEKLEHFFGAMIGAVIGRPRK